MINRTKHSCPRVLSAGTTTNLSWKVDNILAISGFLKFDVSIDTLTYLEHTYVAKFKDLAAFAHPDSESRAFSYYPFSCLVLLSIHRIFEFQFQLKERVSRYKGP